MTIPSDAPERGTDAKATAEAASRTWHEIALRLTPIIGERGFRVLYARSVHLAQSTFPWLIPPAESDQMGSYFTSLCESLERQQPAIAADAQRALLLTFTESLNALIGGALTTRLLPCVPNDDDVHKPAQETSHDR